MLTNYVWTTRTCEVRARKYRFRILNAAVARYFVIALVREIPGNGGEMQGPPGSGVSYDRVGFHMIANDGNIMEYAIPFDGSMDLDGDGNFGEHRGQLPMQSIAERYDIIVDFASQGIQPGDKLYFVNLAEHRDGREPEEEPVSLDRVLRGSYQARVVNGLWEDGDPAVGTFLELRVEDYDGVDQSMDPRLYEPGGLQMVPLAFDRSDVASLSNARHRTFEFGRSSGTDSSPWTVKTDGGQGLTADPRRISAAPQLATGPTDASFAPGTADDDFSTLEIWHLSTGGGWSHPIHIHFEEGVILSRDGRAPPMWETWARKDMYRIGSEDDSSRDIEVAIRFREFAGTYMEHCHNTQHEDHAMLMRWDLEFPGQVTLMPTPIPTWDGVEYVDSRALPTFRSGDGFGPIDGLPGVGNGGGGGGDDDDDDAPNTGGGNDGGVDTGAGNPGGGADTGGDPVVIDSGDFGADTSVPIPTVDNTAWLLNQGVPMVVITALQSEMADSEVIDIDEAAKVGGIDVVAR